MITLTSHSQKGFTTVSGFVLDSISKAPLENTTVLVRDVFSNEVITNLKIGETFETEKFKINFENINQEDEKNSVICWGCFFSIWL